MRAWHICCGVGVVVTVTYVVPVHEHHVQVKGDFLGVARKADFLGATAISSATVGTAAVGPPIRFDERWDEVSHIAVSDIVVPDISPLRPSASPAAPATPPPAEPALVMAQAPSEPREHHAAHHELCAAHGMRREYYHRGGWLYWRCKR